jgi:hypothetical protein
MMEISRSKVKVSQWPRFTSRTSCNLQRSVCARLAISKEAYTSWALIARLQSPRILLAGL